jgi:hypothetical protein
MRQHPFRLPKREHSTPRLRVKIAYGESTKSRIELPGEEKVDVTDLLNNPRQAAALLSKACILHDDFRG